MALELKSAASRCELLEKENEGKTAEIDKALQEAREARSESRAAREEIRQAWEIEAVKPFLLQANTTRKKATSSAGKMATSSAGTCATSIALQLIVSSSVG